VRQILESIHIIDWEFATCGPTFVDLAHFASEAWLQNRFNPTVSLVLSANCRILVGLFKSYRASGGFLDRRKLVYYIGGHICCFLGYGSWTADKTKRKEVAGEGLDLILHAEAQDWEKIKNDAFLAQLLEL